ncbi:hypothetical protein XA68_16449 [Ophiocordyceps unilateralis]|uniref:Uncharacterized protein n=1 Tax=Ophiocordyceps unilateralis TaxID=268505 RepID=A0A2A9PK41_OPHUN|nr:hypothetical protein XA68_16449 [Ophiocordyceps unilateralis]
MAFPFLTWQAFLSGQCVHHPLFRLAMMQCMATPSRFAARLPLHGKRCVSYDKATLTKEALLQKVEAGLGEDAHGNPLQIDVVTKTLSTAAGRLPISPILDPAWIKPRRRQRKERPTEPNGRFRKMLVRNPYAHALATPLRRCVNTNVTLPRYFLQDFELVKHPTTSATWWAPGPLSLDHIIKRSPPSLSITDPGAVESVVVKSPPTDAHQSVGASDAQTSDALYRNPAVLREAPSSAHDHVHAVPQNTMMLGMRTGLAATPDTRESVWREDLGDVLLAMLRRRAVDALIERGRPTRHAKDQSIFNCASWDDVRHVERRGCVLWLPDHNMDLPQQYATLDIEDVQYGSKMVVHDLFWLLGDDQVRRLREESPMFRDGKILVLTHWGSITMMRLHLLLWRLQGYLDRQTAMKQHEARS